MAKVLSGFLWLIRIVLLVLGAFLMLLGGSISVTTIGEILTGTTHQGVPSALGMVITWAFIFIIGYKMSGQQLNDHSAMKQLKEEQMILNRAKAHSGVLTISALALDCGICTSEAKKAFERLAQSGVCQVNVTADGELCYNFPSFIPGHEPENSGHESLVINLPLASNKLGSRQRS